MQNHTQALLPRRRRWSRIAERCAPCLRPWLLGRFQGEGSTVRASRRRGQLALADPLPGVKTSYDGGTLSWLVTGSSTTDVCDLDSGEFSFGQAEPWCLQFAWEFISEAEGLGLRVTCARSDANDDPALISFCESTDQDMAHVSTAEVLEPFWSVGTPDTATAAAVLSAVANVLLHEFVGIRDEGARTSTPVVSRTASVLDGAADVHTSVLRVGFKLQDNEVMADTVAFATREETVTIRSKRYASEDNSAALTAAHASESEADTNWLSGLPVSAVPLRTFLGSTPAVRALSAVLRVAVDGAIVVCEANLTLMTLFRSRLSDTVDLKDQRTLKRLILPWLCETYVPDDVFEALVRGFHFGWPSEPSRVVGDMFAKWEFQNVCVAEQLC